MFEITWKLRELIVFYSLMNLSFNKTMSYVTFPAIKSPDSWQEYMFRILCGHYRSLTPVYKGHSLTTHDYLCLVPDPVCTWQHTSLCGLTFDHQILWVFGVIRDSSPYHEPSVWLHAHKLSSTLAQCVLAIILCILHSSTAESTICIIHSPQEMKEKKIRETKRWLESRTAWACNVNLYLCPFLPLDPIAMLTEQ